MVNVQEADLWISFSTYCLRLFRFGRPSQYWYQHRMVGMILSPANTLLIVSMTPRPSFFIIEM